MQYYQYISLYFREHIKITMVWWLNVNVLKWQNSEICKFFCQEKSFLRVCFCTVSCRVVFIGDVLYSLWCLELTSQPTTGKCFPTNESKNYATYQLPGSSSLIVWMKIAPSPSLIPAYPFYLSVQPSWSSMVLWACKTPQCIQRLVRQSSSRSF